MPEQTSSRDVEYVSRLLAALLVALTVGCAIELWRTWPAQSPGLALAAVLLLQIAALTALWAVPVAMSRPRCSPSHAVSWPRIAMYRGWCWSRRARSLG